MKGCYFYLDREWTGSQLADRFLLYPNGSSTAFMPKELSYARSFSYFEYDFNRRVPYKEKSVFTSLSARIVFKSNQIKNAKYYLDSFQKWIGEWQDISAVKTLSHAEEYGHPKIACFDLDTNKTRFAYCSIAGISNIAFKGPDIVADISFDLQSPWFTEDVINVKLQNGSAETGLTESITNEGDLSANVSIKCTWSGLFEGGKADFDGYLITAPDVATSNDSHYWFHGMQCNQSMYVYDIGSGEADGYTSLSSGGFCKQLEIKPGRSATLKMYDDSRTGVVPIVTIDQFVVTVRKRFMLPW